MFCYKQCSLHKLLSHANKQAAILGHKLPHKHLIQTLFIIIWLEEVLFIFMNIWTLTKTRSFGQHTSISNQPQSAVIVKANMPVWCSVLASTSTADYRNSMERSSYWGHVQVLRADMWLMFATMFYRSCYSLTVNCQCGGTLLTSISAVCHQLFRLC